MFKSRLRMTECGLAFCSNVNEEEPDFSFFSIHRDNDHDEFPFSDRSETRVDHSHLRVDTLLHTFAVRRGVGSHASWTPSEILFIFSTLSMSLSTGALDHRHLLWQTRRATQNHRPSVSIFRLDVASALSYQSHPGWQGCFMIG